MGASGQIGVIHCVSKKTTVTLHTNFNAHKPILLMFGRDIAERIFY